MSVARDVPAPDPAAVVGLRIQQQMREIDVVSVLGVHHYLDRNAAAVTLVFGQVAKAAAFALVSFQHTVDVLFVGRAH